MKKLLTILFTFIALSVSAQNTHKQSNANTVEQFQGAVETKVGLINAHFSDTLEANLSWIKTKPFAQIVTGDGVTWLRNGTATKWIGTGNATINISPDSSSLIICNGIGSCDTIPVAPVAPITNFTVISDTSIVVCGVNSCDTIYTLPINYNQNVVNRVSVVNGVTIDSVFYFINGLRYLAGTIKNAGTQGSILNDSTFLLCNSNSCDTFIVRNITINSFSFTSDSTVSVCNTAGSCDTITFNPIPLGKFFVDSTKIVPGAVDTLFYWINGVKYIGGFINHLSTVNDGIISGGIVTWSGQGLKFYVSPAVYILGGKYYYSALDSVTLAAAPASNSRIDLIGVDTSRHAFVDTGVVSATPIVPQAQVGVQIPLTTGILINSGDTIPVNAIITNVYNENLGEPNEWSTHTENAPITADFNNTVNPKKGTKDVFISRYNSQSIVYFATSTPYTLSSDAVLSGWIFLNKRLVNTIYAFLYNSTTGAKTNAIPLSLDRFDSTSYQQFVLPTSNFTWTGNTNNQFNTIEFYFSGNDTTDLKGLRMDWITLQKGIQSVPPQIDYSNKLDSVFLSNDSLFQYVKGVKTFRGLATGSGSGSDSSAYSSAASVNDSTWSLNAKNGTKTFFQLTQGTTGIVGDTVKFTNPNFVKKSDRFPIGTIKPILAINDSTLAFDSLNLTEIRYSLAARDTTKWTDTTLIDRKFLDARINPVIASVNTNTTAIAGKQNTITLTTTGTSGAATLSGSTLNIPQYTGGGGSSVSVTEQKNYYHGDFWWNHGLDLSTGAITSDSLYDITDYIPIEGNTSITVSLTDSTGFAVGGWTYDSSLSPISAIRSAGAIGTLLTTYTFTTPTNARYLIMYTRAHVGPEHGDSSISRLLRIQSTNPITYNVPITPEQFTGTSDIQRIQKAVNFARWTSSGVTLTGNYKLDSAIILSSGSTLILNNAKLSMNYGMRDNMIRNEAVASHIFNRGNRKIKILGYGSAIMRGSTEAWGSSYPSGVNGQYWRANAILIANVEDLDISGITFKSLNASAIVPEQCREVHINHITFDNGGGEHLNQGGIILGRGDYNFEINNIKGVTQDDIIAVQNIPNYKGDSLYVLGTTINYMPYVKNLDVYGINIRNVDRGYSNRLGTGGLGQKLYGSRIRVMAADSGKVHDVSIDGVSGSQEIYIQVPINTYGVMNKSNVYNLTVSNTGQAPVYVERPITNSSFINVANFDTSGVYQSVVLPDSSLNIYRKYYNSAPVFIDSVYGGTEYIHNSSGLTISTGLTNTGGVITNDLSTGKSGGGTIKGGSAANENITIVPNAYTVSDNGKIYFGRAQTNYYDVANGIWIFTTPPSSTFANFQLKSTSGTITDNVGMQFNGRAYVGWDGSYTATKIGGTSSKVIIANSVTPGAGRMATFDNGNMSLGSITAPNSNLQITSLATGYVAKSTSYTATISDYTIEVTTTGQTITLPTAVGVTGRIYIIKLTASGSSTVATTSSQTIDGSTTYSLSAQNKYVSVQSNGANWVIIGNN